MKKSRRFIDSFIGDYFGESRDNFAENLAGLMAKSKQFLELCEKDLSFAKSIYTNDGSQESRRVYIRALPAYVEGSLNFLRIMPHLYPPLLDRIPNDCLVLFAEPIIELRNRSSVKETIKKTLIGFGKISNANIKSDIMGTRGAQSLLRTFELRGNLMHPRSIEGFNVSDEQMLEAEQGLLWYRQQFKVVISPLSKVVKDLS